jgi:hypothetical protein
MLRTHPQGSAVEVDQQALLACIEACFSCAQSCTACADACLGESMLEELVACIRLNLDCADVCAATGNLLSRQTAPDWQLLRAQLEACATACRVCGAECERHADMHEHCRVCAEMCRECEDSCRRLLA